MNTEPIIRIEKANKWYGPFQVLTDVDLEVRPGERIVICGPSGSGKSTLIRCINHLEKIQRGHIVVDGIELSGHQRKNVDAVRQEVGMVFQQFNLFPHLTVLQNCTLAPIHTRGISREDAITNVILERQPSKEFVKIEEVAALTVFLAGDAAASITGAAYSIDGGWTAQ